jgi:serine/threonine protein kinase
VFRSEGAFAWPRVLRILTGLCDSLGEAHSLGIVHRDLKLENLMLETRAAEADFIKVLDFGLVKLLQGASVESAPGTALGSIAFGSPEALTARPIDHRSDIYSLGVLAFTLIAGHHPFPDAINIGDMVTAHVERIPARLASIADVPIDVDALVATCLEKSPDRRFPDTTTLSNMISIALGASGGFTGATIPEPRLLGEEPTELAKTPKPR